MASTSVDGLVSGLSTSDLISQLMSIEKQGQDRLKTKRTAVNDDITALQAVNSAFASLRDLTSALSRPSAWQVFSANTSDATVATATTTADASTASLSFHVDQLATAASRVSSGSVVSASTVVASGPLTLTKGSGTPVSIDVGDGTLSSVVAAINGANAGVRAAAVQVGAAEFRLQLTSTTSGASSGFTLTGSLGGLGSMNELTAAQDAQVTVGQGVNAYTISSATNTLTALPGVSIALKKAGDVTIDVAPDASAMADKVQKVVDAANAARAAITSRSTYDPSTRKAGVLLGEPGVQSLLSDLAIALTGSTATSSPATVGLSLNRDGTIAFDRSTFTTAYNADPANVASVLGLGPGTGTGGVSLLSAGPRVAAGSYDVVVTSAATRAEKQGAAVATLSAQTISVRVGSTTTTYDVADGADLATVASGLTTALATAGAGVGATVEGGRLVLRASAYGSSAAFDVKSTATDSGLVSTADAWEAATAGTDVQGTINGLAATGVGQFLSGAAGTAVAGLSVKATASGTLTYQPGAMARLAAIADRASSSTDGRLTSMITGRRSEVTTLDGSISAWDLRLALRQTALKKQFSNLETVLGKLKDQSSWLAGQISAL